jgi:hypothetical protein
MRFSSFAPEHFPAKWNPVSRKKMLLTNNLRVFCSQNRYSPSDQVRGHAFAEYALAARPTRKVARVARALAEGKARYHASALKPSIGQGTKKPLTMQGLLSRSISEEINTSRPPGHPS